MLYTSSDAEEAVVWTAVARAVYVEVSAGLCMLRAAGWGRQAGAGRQADRQTDGGGGCMGQSCLPIPALLLGGAV